MEDRPEGNHVSTSFEKSRDAGAIRGDVKYPWGVVANATVKASARVAVSDVSGKFEIRDLDAGRYEVIVEPPFPGYDAPPKNVTVNAGITSVVDFYLDFAKTTVHGYVHDRDGKPIPGAILSDVLCGRDMKSTVTDGTGYFKFEGASPGNLFIRVNAPGYMPHTLDFSAKKGENTKLEFRLTPASCRISGVVSDDGGNPLGGEVSLSSEAMVILQKVPSNAETGYFEFSSVPGTYNVLASAAGFSSEGWRGIVTGDTKVDLKLARLPTY